MTKTELDYLNAKAELDELFYSLIRKISISGPNHDTKYKVTLKEVTIYEWNEEFKQYVEEVFPMDEWWGERGRKWITEKVAEKNKPKAIFKIIRTDFKTGKVTEEPYGKEIP